MSSIQPPPLLSVVIPAYNECASVGAVAATAVQALRQAGYSSYEILLVDDGSTDGTGEAMDQLAAQSPQVRAFHHATNRGLGAALKTGFNGARGEILLWIPGDGQFDLAQVLAGVPLLDKVDIVVALRQGRKERTRSLITTCFHLMLRILFGFDATDICGIYLLRRTLYQQIRPTSENIFLNIEIPLLCVRAGKKVGEIVLPIRPRLAGSSKVANVRTMAKNVWEIFTFRFGLRRAG
jgi:glycosyltransferase involved in cell wall biosynthesis